MAEKTNNAFQQLAERWSEEFGRAVEMFTGEKAEIGAGEVVAISPKELAAQTWWKQVVQAEKAFSVWVGAQESIWNSLTEGAEAQSTFFEMVAYANQGTAAVLSAGMPKPFQVEAGAAETLASTPDAEAMTLKLSFRDASVGSIVLMVERTGLALLEDDEEEEPAAAPTPTAVTKADEAAPPIFSRLLDLRLPVSVILGRAKISIKDALKLMPGSVIELNRHIGEYVEVIVHGTVVARGEIVSVNGNYGVRIKEIISRQERIALHEAA